MKAATTKPKVGFYIDVTCPGCGAGLELEQDFFILSCHYCDSVLRIVMPDTPPAFLVRGRLDKRRIRFQIDRFLKENSLPLTGSALHLKNLYYPFWKVDGKLLKLRNRRERRVVAEANQYQDEIASTSEKSEVSVTPYNYTVGAGGGVEGIPSSLGMRTTFVKAEPFSSEEIQQEFDALALKRSLDSARAAAKSAVRSIDAGSAADFGSNYTELVNPEYSLVYFPYHIAETYSGSGSRRFVIDGVSGQVLAHITPNDRIQRQLNASGQSSDPADKGSESEDDSNGGGEVVFRPGQLSIELHRCPGCGVDLPSEQSYVYICRNCQKPVMMGKSAFVIDRIMVNSSQIGSNDAMFPFWSFGIPEGSAQRLRVVFGGLFNSDRLVVPAFEMLNQDGMHRLCKRLSTAMPKMELHGLEQTDERYRPVGIGMVEAVATAEVLILRELLARGQRLTSDEVSFKPTDVSLFYASFHAESYFYVDSVLGAVTFEKSSVR